MSTQTRSSPKSFLKLSSDVSSFYGFRPIGEYERGVPASERPRGSHTFSSVTKICTSLISIRASKSVDLIPPTEPILVYYATPTVLHSPIKFAAQEAGEFSLSIIGSQESMGEVLLIKVITSILQEWGLPVSCVRINALGDQDNQRRFSKELQLYFRKHLPTSETEKLGDNPTEIYRKLSVLRPDIIADAPRSVSFLSEKNRVHFRNILEQLEILNLPYQLDSSLICDEREQRVMFAIDLANTDLTVCATIGGRYDDFVRRITGKKESATVHASIFFRRQGLDRSSCSTFPKTTAAKIYFVQLGIRAKLRGLGVVDMLRAARMPALQSFDSNHLGIQLAAARQAGVSHVFIMGQREVLDGTIIVRSADERMQSTITLSQLPRYLKTLQA